MDSDVEEEFPIDEAKNIRRNFVFQDGKLSDILAEVKTKIPSLDFDDDTHDDNEDITQLHSQISDDKLVSVLCENHPTIPSDNVSLSAEETLTVLPDIIQTDSTQSNTKQTGLNLLSQTFNSQNLDIKNSRNGNKTRDNPMKLDFNKLNSIDFNKVETALDQFATNLEESSSAYGVVSPGGKLAEHQDETALMARLSNLSKDQLNSCCSIVEKRDHNKHLLDLDKVKGNSWPYQKIEGQSYDQSSVSTKAIHSWTQLGSDQPMSEQPKTIFLDLRPETPTEDEMTLRKHTTSIQRILGLNHQRSNSNSEDDSDNDLEDWQEMRNKYKQKVFKQKEFYEKSAETDRKVVKKPSNQQLASLQSEKSTYMGLSAEELLDGLPSIDENTMYSDFAKTCIRSKSKIQHEEASSVSANAVPLAINPYDLGASLPQEEEEEMVKQPVATGIHKMQHGNNKTFFQAKWFNNQKKEPTDHSKKENKNVGHERQNVERAPLSRLQLNDNGLLISCDEQTCLPSRPASHEEDETTQADNSRETCDTELQNNTIATKKNDTPSTYNQQTTEFKDDKEMKNRQSGTDRSTTEETKGDNLTISDAHSRKLVNGKEACKELTPLKEIEDDYLKTKVTESFDDAELGKEQAVCRIEKEIASRRPSSVERFRKNVDSDVFCSVKDPIEKVASEALQANCSSDEVNVKEVHEEDGCLNMVEHVNEIIDVREIAVDIEKKVKSGYNQKKKVQRKTMNKLEGNLKKLKMENNKGGAVLKNKERTVKHLKYDELTGDKRKMNRIKNEDDAEAACLVEDKKTSPLCYKNEELMFDKEKMNTKRAGVGKVRDPNERFRRVNEEKINVSRKSSPLEERTCEEKIEEEEILIGKTSDLLKQTKNSSGQLDGDTSYVKEISGEEVIKEKTVVNSPSNKKDEVNKNKVLIERQGELKGYLNTNGNIQECLRSKLDTVSAILRRAGRFLTPDENEDRRTFGQSTKKQVMMDRSIAAINKDKSVPEKREVATSTRTFDNDTPLLKARAIVEQMIKEQKMRQPVNRKDQPRDLEHLEQDQALVYEINSDRKAKLKRDLLFSTEGSLMLRERQSSQLKSSRSQLKQRTTKERKELKEIMRKKIESMRSTVSANGKYPAAVNTPIIYDQEASYEQECRSLLPGVEVQLSLLLVVTLLGCGEMNVQRSKGKASGTGAEINCYFTLIAWFLSLGGAYISDGSVPFSIIGMQQVFQNGKLQLFVGVQPNETVYDVNGLPGKGLKNKIKVFNKAITKYLSTHSLRSVYQNMKKLFLRGNYLPVDENLYNSKMLSSCIAVGQDPNAVQRVFESKPGFFWETLEIDDTNEVFQHTPCRDFAEENTIVLVQPSLYQYPSCILDLLCRIEDEGCDLVGLRLAYGETETSDATIFLSHGEHEIVQSREYLGPRHTLALAVRGPSAISKIKAVIGSKLPKLDYPKDVPSLRSLYCSTMCEDKLFYCPSYSNKAAVNLARWFGGRVSEQELPNHDECSIGPKSDSSLSDGVPAQKPPALLVSSTQTAFHLIISPLVPPSFLGHVLHICNIRGFSLRGIRRMHIYKRHGHNLGLSQLQQAAFCPLSANSPFQSPNESPPESPARGKVTFSFESALVSSRLGKVYPSTLVVLQKENGIYHSTTLVKQLSESLAEWKKNNLNDLPLNFEGNPWRLYFSIMQFNESNCKSLWGDVCHKPDNTLLNRARRHSFWSNPEEEQVCVLCAVTERTVQYIGLLLKILYSESNSVAGNWELLAIKSFQSLSLIQAREVTPIEIGEESWESSIKRLMSTAVFSCVLRGVNIIQRLREFMASLRKMSYDKDVDVPRDLDWWLSQTSEVAFRQIAVLFEERELFPDDTNRANMKYVPPLREKVSSCSAKVVFHKKQRRRYPKHVECKNNFTDDSSTSAETIQYREMTVMESLLIGPRPITTVALIKPSCLLNTKNLGKIFKGICQENFRIVALRMSVLTRQEAEVLVRSDDAVAYENVKYLTSGASILMCLQRENAVKKLLDILGPEDPVIARSLDPFLLRGCYGVDSIHNSMHGSETYSASLCEMRMLFPCGLCCDSTVDLEAEQISCRTYDETIGKNSERKLTEPSTESAGIEESLARSLVQINCLILTHRIVYGRFGRKRIALVDVLEYLLLLNFIPVGMKMVLLSEEQIDFCLNMIDLKSEEKQKLINELIEGPCIVIALQRDNAIICFDTIIESAQVKCPSLEDYRKHIIQGSTEKEARNLLLYFFNDLVPHDVKKM